MAANRIAHLFAPYSPSPTYEMAKKVQLGTYIPEDLYADLLHFHEASGVPITRIVENSLRAYLRSQLWADMEGDDDTPNQQAQKRRRKQ